MPLDFVDAQHFQRVIVLFSIVSDQVNRVDLSLLSTGKRLPSDAEDQKRRLKATYSSYELLENYWKS